MIQLSLQGIKFAVKILQLRRQTGGDKAMEPALFVAYVIDVLGAIAARDFEAAASARRCDITLIANLAEFGVNPGDFGDGVVVKGGELLAQALQFRNGSLVKFAKLDFNPREFRDGKTMEAADLLH
jgi:hypothetical protein